MTDKKCSPALLDKIEVAATEAHSVQGRGWHSDVSLERDTRGRIPAWHRDAKYIAMMDPATTLALVAELRELRAKVERVREIHRENTYPDWPVSRCYDCDDVWPCDTIKALGEEA